MQTIITILILLAAIYLAYTVFRSFSGKKDLKKIEGSDALILQNVGPGGVVQLSMVGEELINIDVIVKHKHEYRDGGFSWFELAGESGTGEVSITWEEDNGLDISVTLKNPRMHEVNMTRKNLEKLEDSEGSLVYDDKRYYFEESGEAEYLENCDPEYADEFYYWDFETEDGKHYLSFEAWGNDVEAYYSVPVEERQVTVLSIR